MSLIGYCAVLLERRPTIEWRRRSGRIPTSRELASDYAQANSQLYWMPASISSDEFRVRPSANTDHRLCLRLR